jgi:CcmD family protein
MSNYIYFLITYAVVWVFLAWYMFSLSKKQKVLRDEIQILKNRARVLE